MKLAIRRLCLFGLTGLAIGGVAAQPPAALEATAATDPDTRVWVLRFERGASQLSEAHKGMLDQAAQGLEANPRLTARIVGHSDRQGIEAASLQVSRQRAWAASIYLTHVRGIADDRVANEGRGWSKPVASNETPEGRRRNRRVVVALRDESGTGLRSANRTWVLRFDIGSSLLSGASKAMLDEVVREMNQDPDLRTLIVGHSDNVGPEPMNLEVSRQRAEAAKSYLKLRSGIDEVRVDAQAKGSLKPVASNETAEGQRRNRRVVVVLRKR